MNLLNKSINEIGVHALYDGKHLDVDLMVNENGTKTKMHTILDNKDISKILNIPSDSTPLIERLTSDFIKPQPLPLQEQEQKQKQESSQLLLMDPYFLKKEYIVLKSKKVKRRRKKSKKKKSVANKTKRNRNTYLYKTPSPKTMRIHLSPKSHKSSTSRF